MGMHRWYWDACDMVGMHRMCEKEGSTRLLNVCEYASEWRMSCCLVGFCSFSHMPVIVVMDFIHTRCFMITPNHNNDDTKS